MRTRPIVAATLAYTDDGVPYSPAYDDVYHPPSGAFAQAQYLFLEGNGLPLRWSGRDSFVVLETGFGLGNNFLATWQAWRDDPARCQRLVFISIEQNPFRRESLQRAHAASPAAELAAQLAEAWPPLTPNLHSLRFEGGRVELLLALGDVQDWLPELMARVDAFYLDGFAPARNPQMWQPAIFKALARLAAPAATLATWSSAAVVRQGLRAAGFEVHKAAGRHGKFNITLGRYAPTFVPKAAPGRVATAPSARSRVAIIGAGLAGCAAAAALAELGWSSTVFDRRSGPALETSGNPAGLFHGVVNAQDGTHARFNRTAAMHAQRDIETLIRAGHARGAVEGLLRLDAAPVNELQATLDALGLPADYARGIDAEGTSALAGLPLASTSWFYPGGGWVQPASLAQAWLARSGADFRGGVEVSRLQRVADRWQLRDTDDHVIDEVEVVLLANAGDAVRLLGHVDWPLEIVRGQISLLARPALPTMALPRLPIAGAGYLLPEIDEQAIFGATSQRDDMDAAVRLDDHAANLAQVARLTGHPWPVHPSMLAGRTGWRCMTPDRLPIIGAVPDEHAASTIDRPLDQPRWVPRQAGLFVFTALGSRGITWSGLGARAVASLITGAPVPLETSLLDAVDPARFISRAVRRGLSSNVGSSPPSRVARGRHD